MNVRLTAQAVAYLKLAQNGRTPEQTIFAALMYEAIKVGLQKRLVAQREHAERATQ